MRTKNVPENIVLNMIMRQSVQFFSATQHASKMFPGTAGVFIES